MTRNSITEEPEFYLKKDNLRLNFSSSYGDRREFQERSLWVCAELPLKKRGNTCIIELERVAEIA